MAKAKAKKKLVEEYTYAVDRGVESVDGPLVISEVELRTLDMYEAQVKMNEAVRDKFVLQERVLGIEYLNAKNELRGKQAGAEASRIEAQDGYNATRQAIQVRLGIDLNDYVVSDSGELRYIKEDGESKLT